MIGPDVTVARLLEEHPALLEVLAGLHPHFRQLRNRVMRRLMAPRVTLAQAARMAGLPLDDVLDALRRAAGEPEGEPPDPARPPASAAGARPEPPAPGADRAGCPAPPAGLRPVLLDVREDVQRGREPFPRIMTAVRRLAEGEALVLRAPFEPLPLYDVLGRRGLAHWTERASAGDWTVWFYRAAPAAAAPAPTAAEPLRTGSPPTATLDVRGLEPPEPMVRVLQQVERLGPGEALLVVHERRPVFLYPQLDARGLAHETVEAAPGVVHIVIRRPPEGGA